ncbi:hypothetical protein Trydic_g3864 [Trypoxylus dichotomus]
MKLVLGTALLLFAMVNSLDAYIGKAGSVLQADDSSHDNDHHSLTRRLSSLSQDGRGFRKTRSLDKDHHHDDSYHFEDDHDHGDHHDRIMLRKTRSLDHDQDHGGYGLDDDHDDHHSQFKLRKARSLEQDHGDHHMDDHHDDHDDHNNIRKPRGSSNFDQFSFGSDDDSGSHQGLKH